MLERFKRMALIENISKSFTKKLMSITLLGLLLGFILSITISNQGLIHLKNESVNNFKDQLDNNTQQVLTEYLENIALYVECQLSETSSEQSVLREITQRYFDDSEELSTVQTALNQTTILRDSLIDNGRYLQNAKSDSGVLLVQGYLLAADRQPTAETAKMISKTAFLNGLLVPFQNSQNEKLQVYFTGKPQANIYRVAPWMNLGQTFDEIYPAHNSTPNWDAFYPGLINTWQEAVMSGRLSMKQETPIVIPPTQDAATGQVAISIKSAVWSKDRRSIEGTISYDLSIDQLVKKIQNLHVSKNAFAFLSQSNGNVFAINDMGLKALGIEPSRELVQSETDAFKVLKRSFKDSKYTGVQNIVYPTTDKIKVQKLEIEGKRYWLMTKQLEAFKTWDASLGLRDERWVLGFVIPEADFAPPYKQVASSIENSTREILLRQALIILLLFAFITTIIFMIYEKLTRNLNMLIKATEQIRKRDFDVSISLDSQDEFGVLAQSFNDMTSEIKATVQQLTAQNDLLKDEMDSKIRMDEQIAYMKQYDSLTGLPNKQSLYRRLDEYCAKSIQENRLGALVVIGLDNFKRINEAYGVEVGDELLRAVAERLREDVHADSVARITGDEFGVVFYGLSVLDDLIARLDHLKYMLNQQFYIGGSSLYITASYGISSFPEDATNAKEIVKFATNALLSAKENAKDHYRFYDSNIEQNIKNKVELMNALRQSVERDELKLVYQPIVNSATGRFVGVEALLRWNNHQFGYIPPNIFIPIAEEIKFISQLERWVVKRAISDLELMNANGINDLYVSINLSALDLDSDDFMDYLETQLRSNNVASGQIQLEITEGVLINRYEHIVPRLRKLAAAGVHIALDDFGTGYSSLKYIKRLPIDCLKIDRSFVKDYPDYDDGAIAKIIINLAETLKMSVIAEGVETRLQAHFLEASGCMLHQGYYYSKGLPLDQIMARHKEEGTL